jgi:hypothetical protein
MTTTMLRVSSRTPWVCTPIWVNVGSVLTFRAQGFWVDLVIPCDADGYRARWLYALHEYPRIMDHNRYFRLMGRISANGQQPHADDIALTFTIGKERKAWESNATGRIFLFVNDRNGFYWNNWGAIRLRIDVH